MTAANITEPLSLQLETVYKTEHIIIRLDKQLKFVYVEWLKHPSSEIFRQDFKKAIEICLSNECQYWLSEAHAIHYLEFADQNWMLELIYPLLPKSNLLKFARVNTVESIALMDVARICTTLEQLPEFTLKTQLEVFSSKESALNWLFDGRQIADL